MRRREFIALLGCAVASPMLGPLAARAQQPMPVVGFLISGTSDESKIRVDAFRQGLSETGYVEGRGVTIEYRYADNQYGRLPGLAAELVSRQVAAIFAGGGGVAPQAAKAATATIPVVFAGGLDPIQAGLVASLNHPGGNVTGVTFLTNALEAKRLGLLHELVPQAHVIAVLFNPGNASAEREITDLTEAARALGLELRMERAGSVREFEPAFADFGQGGAGGLLVASDAFLSNQAEMLAALAARYKLPAIYNFRDFPVVGGLASYGTSRTDAYRQAGAYVGRILKGEKPADLPVFQSTKFEFVMNLKTAKTLGLKISDNLLSLADEVIE